MPPAPGDGVASVVALLQQLLWWGGLLGCVVLVGLSVASRRAELARGRPDTLLRRVARDPTADPWGGGGPVRTRPGHDTLPARRGTVDRGVTDRLATLAVWTAGAAGIHLVMVWPHLGEGLHVAAFFVLAGLTQTAQAALLLTRPTPALLRAVVLTATALVALWLVSRTVGVLGVAEPVGSWDLVAVTWETASAVVALRLLARERAPALPRADLASWGAAPLFWLAVTALVLVLLPGSGHG